MEKDDAGNKRKQRQSACSAGHLSSSVHATNRLLTYSSQAHFSFVTQFSVTLDVGATT